MTNEQKNTPVAEDISTPILAQENKPVNLDIWLEQRKDFIEKVKTITKEGLDYHVIKGKKSLAKGGAEKIASIFRWTARFEKDTDVMDAFSQTVKGGFIAFVCNLEKDNTLMGQGRGAAMLSGNSGDLNKTIKMAQKSAYIDAVIRASGLSDIFTQDLEDMDVKEIKPQVIKYVKTSEVQAAIKNAVTLEQLAQVENRMKTAMIRPDAIEGLRTMIKNKKETLDA